MAQNRPRPARQNSSNEATGDRELPVPERVHAPPERLQAASRDAVLDCASIQPALAQLGDGHHPVLPRRDLGNEGINVWWRDFSMAVMGFSHHPGNIALPGSPGGAVCNGGAKRALLAAGAVRAAAALQWAHLGARLAACLLGH